ncbi:hypothetical protein BDZ97DRAFT_1759282 [Flammula alnicola]|nr:hypothetical protein BDZ97DRAFT_1759282 [Flammula alnicola]
MIKIPIWNRTSMRDRERDETIIHFKSFTMVISSKKPLRNIRKKHLLAFNINIMQNQGGSTIACTHFEHTLSTPRNNLVQPDHERQHNFKYLFESKVEEIRHLHAQEESAQNRKGEEDKTATQAGARSHYGEAELTRELREGVTASDMIRFVRGKLLEDRGLGKLVKEEPSVAAVLVTLMVQPCPPSATASENFRDRWMTYSTTFSAMDNPTLLARYRASSNSCMALTDDDTKELALTAPVQYIEAGPSASEQLSYGVIRITPSSRRERSPNFIAPSRTSWRTTLSGKISSSSCQGGVGIRMPDQGWAVSAHRMRIE